MGSFMHRYAALGSLIQRSQGIAVASMLNRGNVFVSPYNCPFPFHQDEMPPSISSPAWSTLDLNATGVDHLHPEGLHPDQMQSGCLQAWHSSHLAGLAIACMPCIPPPSESVSTSPWGLQRGCSLSHHSDAKDRGILLGGKRWQDVMAATC